MLTLVTLTTQYRNHLTDMMDEWTAAGEDIVPYSIRRLDYHRFDEYLTGFDEETAGLPGFVPATTWFCLDTERDIFVGAVNLRHELNEALLKAGGHIGDGVRPSERRKGYATRMIGLVLDECRKLGIDKVLITCDRDNIGSAKSICSNGGVLENEIEDDGKIKQRYWITL